MGAWPRPWGLGQDLGGVAKAVGLGHSRGVVANTVGRGLGLGGVAKAVRAKRNTNPIPSPKAVGN